MDRHLRLLIAITTIYQRPFKIVLRFFCHYFISYIIISFFFISFTKYFFFFCWSTSYLFIILLHLSRRIRVSNDVFLIICKLILFCNLMSWISTRLHQFWAWRLFSFFCRQYFRHHSCIIHLKVALLVLDKFIS